VKLRHGDVEVTILDGAYVERGVPTPEAERYYTALCSRLDEYRRFAAERLLALYNDTWFHDEIGHLDLAAFAARLAKPAVVLYDQPGVAAVYFHDGDIFGGHAIEISIEGETAVQAELVG